MSGGLFAQRRFNRATHTIEVLQNVAVPEAQHPKAMA
jgi:hypothetical protein